LSISGSLLAWISIAVFMMNFEFKNFCVTILLYFAITILSVWFLEKKIKIKSLECRKKYYSLWQITFRALFGGSIVSAIVVISKFCSPYVTGIVSTFPAMLLSTFIILTINQGKEFAMATGKVLIISLTNILIYSIMVKFTYPKLGILFGTIVSYLISSLWILLLHPLVKRLS
jgi:uncharacterized membrane protein (GlpM family)